MANSSFQVSCVFVFCTCLGLLVTAQSRGQFVFEKPVPVFFFGDSFFDAGNNNYVNTTFRANYWPYGETFFKNPTGRFSDGRLISDFIGAGALVETSQGLVIDLHSQLSYFKSVRKSLNRKLGDEQTKTLLSRAVYLFSVGGNDYTFPFEKNSSVLGPHPHEEFVGLVIGNITAVIKEIYREGGRNFGFLGLDPLACLPYSRAVVEGQNGGGCFDKITPYVKLHNKLLPKLLQKLEREFKGFRFSLSQIYEFLTERISHPSKYGFEEGKVACCGSGPYRGIYSCGGKRGTKEYDLCKNVSEYVYFDSGHPTERVFQQIADQFWNGAPNSTVSYNLKTLFETKY